MVKIPMDSLTDNELYITFREYPSKDDDVPTGYILPYPISNLSHWIFIPINLSQTILSHFYHINNKFGTSINIYFLICY